MTNFNPKSSKICCISHEFYKIATKYPTKIAIINSKKLPIIQTYDVDGNRRQDTGNNAKPPGHVKDNFFTFSELLSAIDSLTFKINCIINGGDDPSLIKPTSYNNHLNNKINGSKNRLIGVYMVPSVEYIVTVLSILRCGFAFLPIDPFWPKERILSVILCSNVDLIVGCFDFDDNNSTHLINKSQTSVSLAGKGTRGEDLINKSQMSISLDGKVMQGDTHDLGSAPVSIKTAFVTPFTRKKLIKKSHWLLDCCKIDFLRVSIDDILEEKSGEFDLIWPCESSDLRKFSYLMYTSGSTGKPKGVCGSEKAVLNRFLWMQELYPLSYENDVLLFKTSISFVDHIQEFLAPMLGGCTLVIPPFDELKRNMFGLVDFVHEYSITRLTVVPSLIRTILPALERRYSERIESSLKMLVLSGEVFTISLWKMVSRILPRTCILNIYGSTEVAGDCTYFDCKRLPLILKSEMLSSVPIGEPICNCDVRIVNDDGKQDEGELCVTGVCVSSGYYSEGEIISLDCIRLKEDSDSCDGRLSGELFYRTGDFARRLQGGDLVFLGRKDRTIKVNGQRIALEEVEETLRGHPKIAGVAVVFCNQQKEHAFLGAALVLKDTSQSPEVLASLKSWMVDRFPSAMIPREILCVEAIPMSSSGKVDYTSLSSSLFPVHYPNEGHIKGSVAFEHIKETFSKALGTAEVGNDDDFFALGGDSILAAHVAHKLGIDMRLLYMFPSPSQLHEAFFKKKGALDDGYVVKWETLAKARKDDLLHSFEYKTSDFGRSRKRSKTFLTPSDEHGSSTHLKVDTGAFSKWKTLTSTSFSPWESLSVPAECSFGRCNKRMHKINTELDNLCPETLEVRLPNNIKGTLRETWRVPMDSCVDASPLVVFNNDEILIFIGSHSHKFVCVNARNGLVIWETKLEGRIESSAVVDGDFSQVIVGCYQGNIYFIDILTGTINWTFQTGGEVKSQPTVDRSRNLIWCGSHDHNLYGLDYRNHCCVYQFPCGGTIFGSPVTDEVREILYLGTTNGRLIAITLKDSSFSSLWLLDLKAPLFGSLSISSNGNVICCLLNGDVLSVNLKGSIVWRSETDGPIFAGPCLSMSLGSQTLICTRNGRVYSFDIETGCVTWEYNVGDPIISSAYVDDHTNLVSDNFSTSQRLVCVCSSSGRVLLLLVSYITTNADRSTNPVRKFAEINLEGEVFSSPVMVAGRIFVGCRDDYLHCLVAEANLESD